MLNIQNLSKSYGGHALFENVTLQMGAGERLGLVGRNGCGKSTLLKLILKEEEPDDGLVAYPRHYRIGKLDQHLSFSQKTLLAEACLGLPAGEEDHHYKAERILSGLGFTQEDMERAPETFSGGFQIRLSLAKVLVSHPNLLLLDEPTNYLDIVSIRWIIKFLRQWKNELILISHDREFMDQVTTHTALIHRHALRKVPGTTEKLYAQILQEEEIHEKTRLNESKKRQQEEAFINRFRAQATKASAVQSRIKRLGKTSSLEKLSKIDTLDFSFRPAPFIAKRMLEARELSFHYEESAPLIQELALSIQPGERVAIIGKNGKGKSTLMSLLAGELTPTQGDVFRHNDVKMGYFGQTNIARLDTAKTIEDEIFSANQELSRTAVRTICGTMMFSGTQAEKKISVLSGGEKSRVLLGKILARPANLILLDEPTNHLDMESIEALLSSIAEFSGAVVIVTHSEMILKNIATKLVIFHRGKVEVFNDGYEEFLKKVGWEDEGTSAQNAKQGSRAVSGAGLNKKELRRARSQIITARSQILNPLKKEITALEEHILQQEEQIAEIEQKMMAVAASNETIAIADLAKEMGALKRKVDVQYAKLDRLSTEHDEKAKDFAAKLSALEPNS